MTASAPKTAARSLAIIAAVAVLLPLPLLQHDGWPRMHEKFAALERIEGFRRAFAAGIWYPVWTPFAGWGWGSPYPLFYHRLYPTLGALLSFATGSVLTTFKALIVLLLFGTGAGMRRLLRVAGVSEWLATAGALLLIASPYVLTDWVVRNAMAELTALMILPWLYAELALVEQDRPRWIVLGGGIVLLFHAHSLIAYFFLLSLALFLLLRVKQWRSLICSGGKHMLVASAVVMIGILPTVLVSSDLLRFFNVGALTNGMWRVEANYHPLSQLFVDPFDWLTWQAEKLSVEMNRYVWVALLVVIPLLLATDHWKQAARTPLHLFFALWGTLCLFLQMPDFVVVFHLLPKAEFLQFPWRLLSFLSIAAIFVLMVWAEAALRVGGRVRAIGVGAAGGALALTLAHFGSVPWRRHDVENFSSVKLAAKLANLDGPNSFGEYLLPGMGQERPLPPPKQPIIKADCADRLKVPESFSATGLELTANLDAPCRVSIRQFQTPLLAIEVENGEVLSPTPADEIVVELNAGPSSVRIRERSFLELLSQWPHAKN
jgi:hypothetical protein